MFLIIYKQYYKMWYWKHYIRT